MTLNWHVKKNTRTQIYKFSANNLECNKHCIWYMFSLFSQMRKYVKRP